MNGQSSIRLDALCTDSSFGAEAFYCQYTLSGYWETGLSGKYYNRQTSAGVKLGGLHCCAAADYMFRLVGSRNRAVSLYGGGGAFLGYEVIDPFGIFPTHYHSNLHSGYFLYGIQAKLSAELFVSKTCAFTLNGNIPFNFSSPMGWFHFDGGIGVKFML